MTVVQCCSCVHHEAFEKGPLEAPSPKHTDLLLLRFTEAHVPAQLGRWVATWSGLVRPRSVAFVQGHNNVLTCHVNSSRK